MRMFANKTWIALIGSVAFPLAALIYLAGMPEGGRGSLLAILLQVAIVAISFGLFAIFLAKIVEQMNARRVRRWLDSAEGREWLDELPDDDRAEFLDRLASKAPASPLAGDAESPVDSPDATR